MLYFATRKELFDVESSELKFWANNYEVTFNIQKSMKHSNDMNVVSYMDVIDQAVASVVRSFRYQRIVSSYFTQFSWGGNQLF